MPTNKSDAPQATIKKQKPIRVKVGTISVPVYRLKDGRWQIIYREAAKAPRKTVFCRTELEAREKAKSICVFIARGQIEADDLSADRRLQAVTAHELLSPLGLSLDAAAREVAAAHELTGGAGILEMARFWARHHYAATSNRTCQEVLAEMLSAKQGQGLDAHYLRNLREPLEKFALAFPGPIAEISAAEIRSYLEKLTVEPRTRNNIRALLVMLFRFARSAKDLPDAKTTEAEQVGKVKVRRKAPHVYTAVHLQRWLSVVPAEWMPWMLLGAFAGVRTAEIGRMDWTDIQWITREIYIRPEVAKTGEGRYVPMQDNLVAWLTPLRKGHGRIIPEVNRINNITARMQKVLKENWDRNALRHSYGSHRLGITQDLAKLTVEMGNSIAVNRRNYQNPRSRQQCVEYFNLYPASGSNVVSIA